MKKWYAAVGILATLLIVSMVSCVAISSDVDKLKDDLRESKAELRESKAELGDTAAELERVSGQLVQLSATKEISFGNGLRVFDIEKGSYEVSGKVENISSEPMQKVVILVAFYNADGQLDEDWGSVDDHTVQDLFPGEVMEWKVHFGNWTDQDTGLFAVYAIGNRGE